MRARSANRQALRRLAILFAACFIVGTAGVLLAGCTAPEWLARLWPWARPADPDDDPDPSPVIYVGQVLKVPLPTGAGDPPPLPDPPKTVTKGAAGSSRVALTFDAGWEYAPTLPLLQVLRDNDLQVTFFPRAKWLEDHPDLAAAILADGHEIGSHSYTHPHMTGLDAVAMDAEISQAKQALLKVAGADAFVPLYRPPYGEHNAAVSSALARHGYGYVVMWQVDTLDWQSPGVDAIVNKTLDKVTDGGIVLMHIGTMQTVEALPRILVGLAQRNLAVVKVSELLGLTSSGGGTTTYTVKAGDTLYSIAGSYATTVEVLLDLNPQIVK